MRKKHHLVPSERSKKEAVDLMLLLGRKTRAQQLNHPVQEAKELELQSIHVSVTVMNYDMDYEL